MPSQDKIIKLAWIKQGTIRWEDWWTQRHGETLKEIPGLKEHVSFANFDLRRGNFSTIILEDDLLEIHNVPSSKLEELKKIIEYHGFKIILIT